MTRIFLVLVLVSAFGPLDAGRAGAQPAAIRLTVADAVSRGFANSHRLAEIKARQEGAEAAERGQKAADRPLISASGGYTRTNHVDAFSLSQGGVTRVLYPDLPDNAMSRVGFDWPIYTSGRVDALERAASAEAQALGADREAAQADLRLEIVRAYWAVATSREAERVIEASVGRVQAQLDDVRQRFTVGLVPPNDVSSLDAQQSRERAQLIEARNVRESALVDLRRLIGADPDTEIDLADALDGPSSPDVPAVPGTAADVPAIVQHAIAERPERKSLTFRIDGALAREHAAATAARPTIALRGGVDYANPNPRIFPRQGTWQESWDLSVNVNWLLHDFGRTEAQVAEATAAVRATRERLAEFDTLVAADVRQRLLDLDSGRALVRAASDAVSSAAEARRVIADRFAAGLATSTDVLVAQVAQLEAELTRTRAIAAVRLAEARLQRALGRP